MILKQRAVTKQEMAEIAEILKRVMPKGEYEAEAIARFVSMFGRK